MAARVIYIERTLAAGLASICKQVGATARAPSPKRFIGVYRAPTISADGGDAATVTAEAGAIFASASVSLGMIVMYRESRTFDVAKKSPQSPCGYKVMYRNQHVNAPLGRGDACIFRMQLRNPSRVRALSDREAASLGFRFGEGPSMPTG